MTLTYRRLVLWHQRMTRNPRVHRRKVWGVRRLPMLQPDSHACVRVAELPCKNGTELQPAVFGANRREYKLELLPTASLDSRVNLAVVATNKFTSTSRQAAAELFMLQSFAPTIPVTGFRLAFLVVVVRYCHITVGDATTAVYIYTQRIFRQLVLYAGVCTHCIV